MADNKMHTYGEFDPGLANVEALERFRVVAEAVDLLRGSVRVAHPDLSPPPVAEQPNVAAPADAIAQYSATAALSQQVDSLRL